MFRDFQIEAALLAERARLVRLCARISGDPDAAEDLAQETLIEAWRHRQRLHNPRGYAQWLSAIARNVSLRWARRRGRERARLAQPIADRNTALPVSVDELADTFDLEIELERSELAVLLDRALALLPAETRAALVARYVEETPVAQVAAQLGMSEGAVAVRLHRGRLALRRVLETKLGAEAAAYGLIDANATAWRPTSVWCPHCGQHRLVVQTSTAAGLQFWTRCPDCRSAAGAYFVQVTRTPLQADGHGFRHVFSNVIKETADHFWRAHRRGAVSCARCGRQLPVRALISDGTLLSSGARIIGASCAECGTESWTYHTEMVLYLPAGRRFWWKHGRIRALPEQEIDVGGCPAIVTRFEDVTSTIRLEVVSIRDTLEVMSMHEIPQ
jgi:RNA polymerase sigma-70 factor (ECF subfamily)